MADDPINRLHVDASVVSRTTTIVPVADYERYRLATQPGPGEIRVSMENPLNVRLTLINEDGREYEVQMATAIGAAPPADACYSSAVLYCNWVLHVSGGYLWGLHTTEPAGWARSIIKEADECLEDTHPPQGSELGDLLRVVVNGGEAPLQLTRFRRGVDPNHVARTVIRLQLAMPPGWVFDAVSHAPAQMVFDAEAAAVEATLREHRQRQEQLLSAEAQWRAMRAAIEHGLGEAARQPQQRPGQQFLLLRLCQRLQQERELRARIDQWLATLPPAQLHEMRMVLHAQAQQEQQAQAQQEGQPEPLQEQQEHEQERLSPQVERRLQQRHVQEQERLELLHRQAAHIQRAQHDLLLRTVTAIRQPQPPPPQLLLELEGQLDVGLEHILRFLPPHEARQYMHRVEVLRQMLLGLQQQHQLLHQLQEQQLPIPADAPPPPPNEEQAVEQAGSDNEDDEGEDESGGSLRYSRGCGVCKVENPPRRAALIACGHTVCVRCVRQLVRSTAVNDAAAAAAAAAEGRPPQQIPDEKLLDCPLCRKRTGFVRLYEDVLETPPQ